MESQIEEIKEQIEQIMDFIMRPNSAGGGPVTNFGGPPPMMAGGGFDIQMPGGYDSHMPPSGAPMPGMASDYSAERFPGAHGPLDMDHWMSDSVGWPRDGPREHGRRTVSRENARLPRDDYTEDDQDNEERRSPRSRRRSSRHHQSSSPSHVASAYRAEPFRGAYQRPDMDVRMSGSAARPRDGPREHGRRTTSRKNGVPPRDDYTEGDQDNDEGWLPRSRRRISRHHQSSSSSHMASAYSAEPFPGAYQRPDMDVRMSGSCRQAKRWSERTQKANNVEASEGRLHRGRPGQRGKAVAQIEANLATPPVLIVFAQVQGLQGRFGSKDVVGILPVGLNHLYECVVQAFALQLSINYHRQLSARVIFRGLLISR
ncbi:hypothetical protein MTO96_034084 [Rhipicephalus appendiculatus]